MSIKKIIAREGRAIVLISIFGVILELCLVQFLNFIDKTSWRYYTTIGSILWTIAFLIMVYYVIRFIIWTVKKLKAK